MTQLFLVLGLFCHIIRSLLKALQRHSTLQHKLCPTLKQSLDNSWPRSKKKTSLAGSIELIFVCMLELLKLLINLFIGTEIYMSKIYLNIVRNFMQENMCHKDSPNQSYKKVIEYFQVNVLIKTTITFVSMVENAKS